VALNRLVTPVTFHRDNLNAPYRHLAAELVRLAMVDFGVLNPEHHQRVRGLGRQKQRRTTYLRLSDIRIKIDAGRFLLERDDPRCLLWFRWTGLDWKKMRAEKADWRARLAGLRAAETVLKKKLDAITQAEEARREKKLQAKLEKEKTRGANGKRTVDVVQEVLALDRPADVRGSVRTDRPVGRAADVVCPGVDGVRTLAAAGRGGDGDRPRAALALLPPEATRL
jgi:hypothetical protein